MIEKRIGVSTHFMPSIHGESLEDAISMVSKAGFTCFELVPVEFQAQIGYPYNHPNVGVWPRTLTSEERRAIKDRLSVFDLCTVHGPHLDVNIASSNGGIREESVRQYMECLQLAVDLGIEIVTFHMGRQTSGFIRSAEDMVKYGIQFAQKAVEFAKAHGLKVGYETGGYNSLKKVFENFSPQAFGLNLDLGHAAMQRIGLLQWIESFGDRLVEVHFNSVCHYWGGFMEHTPVRRNNVIDFQTVIPKLKNIGFEGPIVCELQGNDIQQMIEVCQEAKNLIVRLWKAPPSEKMDPWACY